MNKLTFIIGLMVATISAFAQNKTGYSYTTSVETKYQNYVLKNAFDGDLSSMYWTELRAGSASNHTKIKAGDYYMVTFDKATSLSDIKVYQGGGDYFTNVWEMQVSPDGKTWNSLGKMHDKATTVNGKTLSAFTLASGAVKAFRVYATTSKEYDNWLQIYEVTWTETPMPAAAAAPSAALTEKFSGYTCTTSLETHYQNYVFKNAFDGNLSSMFWTELRAGGASNHTKIKTGDFVMVTFDKATALSEIKVYQGGGDYFTNVWEMQVSTDGNTWNSLGKMHDKATTVDGKTLSTFALNSTIKAFRISATVNKEYDNWLQVYEITWSEPKAAPAPEPEVAEEPKEKKATDMTWGRKRNKTQEETPAKEEVKAEEVKAKEEVKAETETKAVAESTKATETPVVSETPKEEPQKDYRKNNSKSRLDRLAERKK